jgi:hypothetical protein
MPTGNPLTGGPFNYADNVLFSSWARESIDIVSRIHIGNSYTRLMQGIGQGLFAPKVYYTVEQSAATLMRLVDVAK